MEKELSYNEFDEVIEGTTVTWGEPAYIFAERTVRLEDGRIVEQYLYHPPVKHPNGKPFVALKANISIR